MSAELPSAEPEAPTGERALPFIVGVGASAGGLEAIRELVKNLPARGGAAYVVVQHMSPQHPSLLATLLGRETALPVRDVTDGVRPEADAIYVTPPNHDVTLERGALRLKPPNQTVAAPKPSVDRFFTSIARDVGERAVGVVLSGTGSDGSYGVQTIREVGGITIAQDDQTAKYDGMPTSAVATGCVDLVLPPAEIGRHLSRILAKPRDFAGLTPEHAREQPITGLLQVVLARTRVDFRDYKPTTVQRRIERRMTALAIAEQEEYTDYCRANPQEVDALFRDLLISVTRFFRDPEEFTALRAQLAALVDAAVDAPLRVWVAGCATGEEAYSIAILLAEAMGGPGGVTRERLQIFATDIDGDALQVARRGRYTLAAVYDIPAPYLDRYFRKAQDGLEVIDTLKDVIMFSKHNVFQDPPFLNIDLVCCRNLLIYFGASLQARVLSRFHYALKPNGLLFLGTAETVAGSEMLFRPEEGRAHLWRRRTQTANAGRHFPSGFERGLPRRWTGAPPKPGEGQPGDGADRAMFDALARSVGPDALLATTDMRILRVYGDFGGLVTLNERSRLQLSVAMLRDPLGAEARTLATLAIRNLQPRRGLVHVIDPDAGETVQVEAIPLVGSGLDEKLVLLAFRRRRQTAAESPPVNAPGHVERIQLLEREVENTREALQQTIEELETSNEELQSLNEELQSTNEELQATNEELETSNEELQSTNEELVTVNEELQINSTELAALSEELGSVLENIPTAVLVVDEALQISRASAAAVELFRLRSSAPRAHLSQCAAPRGFPSLPEICNEAIRLGQPSAGEAISGDRLFLMTCAPFRDTRGAIAGATMVFTETPVALKLSRQLQKALDEAPVMMLHLDAAGRILGLSASMAELLGVDAAQALGRPAAEALGTEVARAMAAADARFLAAGETNGRGMAPEEIGFTDRAGERRWVAFRSHRHTPDSGGVESVYRIGLEVTDLRRKREELARFNQHMALAQEMAGLGYWSYDAGAGEFYWSEALYDIHGVERGAPVSSLERMLSFYHPEDRAAAAAAFDGAIATGREAQLKLRIVTPAGRETPIECWIRAEASGGDGGRRLMGVVRRV